MGPSLMEILNRVRAGEMTVYEGAASLEALEDQGAQTGESDKSVIVTGEVISPETLKIEPEIGWWKYAWLVVLLTGTAVFALGAWVISWAYPSRHMFWFYCAWLPLLLGLLVLLIGAWSRFARWLHVRVLDAGGHRVSISLPIPISLLSLGIRLFGSRIKGMEDQNPEDVAAVIQALGKTHDPISVEVDEKGGDRVRVYIL